MSIMTWKTTYSVGIDKIDDQHKVLIEMLNKLYDAMRQGKGKEVMVNLLTELVNYTMYHFKTEEDIFAKYDYSKSAEHKKQHKDLKVKVDKLFEDVNSGKASISLEVFNFLKEWINIHILQSDLLYAQEFVGKVK